MLKLFVCSFLITNSLSHNLIQINCTTWFFCSNKRFLNRHKRTQLNPNVSFFFLYLFLLLYVIYISILWSTSNQFSCKTFIFFLIRLFGRCWCNFFCSAHRIREHRRCHIIFISTKNDSFALFCFVFFFYQRPGIYVSHNTDGAINTIWCVIYLQLTKYRRLYVCSGAM